jgi:hypothetical protein
MSRLIFPYVALGLLGLTVGVLGTGGHRFKPAVGIVCTLVLVAAAAVFARAWKSWLGLLVFFHIWLAAVLLLYFTRGPGNSVVMEWDGLGMAWIFGGIVAAATPVVIPRRLLVEDGNGGR